MSRFPLRTRTLAMIVVLAPLFLLFVYVALRTGPMAPVSVVLATVENQSLTPALFGIGTVEARHTYKIGPTAPGRLKNLEVRVGELVTVGQVLGEMESVDLVERIRVQDAALQRADAQVSEARVRKNYAKAQASRYEQLLKARSASEEVVAAKRQELLLAETSLASVGEERARVKAERGVLEAQLRNLSLISPVNGLVVARNVDPGTTVVAGQAVVELIDPNSLWVNVQFDQIATRGLDAGLSAQITLRSQIEGALTGSVLRAEPLADAVTEEARAKIIFDQIPEPLPPIGELAEVTIALPALAASPVIPNAAIHYIDGRLGVWQVMDDDFRFTPVELGIADLEGRVQIRKGLKIGDQVIVYSETPLTKHRRMRVVEQISGVPQ